MKILPGDQTLNIRRLQRTLLFLLKCELLTQPPNVIRFDFMTSFPNYKPQRQARNFNQKLPQTRKDFNLYGSESYHPIDFPFIRVDEETKLVDPLEKFSLQFGLDLRTEERLTPLDHAGSTKSWGNTLLDRHMICANYLCGYTVYRNMKVFMILYAVAAGKPISQVFVDYSYHRAAAEPLGHLAFCSDFMSTMLILREKATFGAQTKSCVPSIQDLILSHQLNYRLGYRTYVLQLDLLGDIPELFVIECYRNYILVKRCSGGNHQYFDLEGFQQVDLVNQLLRANKLQDAMPKLVGYLLYEVRRQEKQALDERYNIIRGLIFAFK